MRNNIELNIIPKINFLEFNQVVVSIKDINPEVKLEKKRYSFSKTTSNY
ncbi:MAG: hypothetical protein PWQ28_224 [Candidatus Woesearchaeota archaeon]|nr:hypothetical protein [Candidatus Woesearchaeota archaeon]